MRLLAIFIISLVVACHSAIADDNCVPKLFQDVSYKFDLEATKLSVLSNITKEQFDQAKTNEDSGASAVIEGVPMSGYQDYSSFRQALDRESSLYKFDLDHNSQIVTDEELTSDNDRDEYRTCELSHMASGVGLFLENTPPFATDAIVDIIWKGGVGGPKGVLENGGFQIAGASLENTSKIPKNWLSDQSVPIIVKRDPTKDAVLVVEISGYSGNIRIPASPPAAIVTEPVVTTQPVFIKTDKDALSKVVCITKPPNGFLLPQTAAAIPDAIKDDDGRNKAILVPPQTPDEVCMEVETSTGAIGVDHEITAHLSVTERVIAFN